MKASAVAERGTARTGPFFTLLGQCREAGIFGTFLAQPQNVAATQWAARDLITILPRLL